MAGAAKHSDDDTENIEEFIKPYFIGQNEEQVEWAIRYLFDLLTLASKEIPGTAVLGPAPLNVVKVNDRFRYRVNVTGKNSAAIRKALSAAIIECSGDKRFRGVSVFADHDPSD